MWNDRWPTMTDSALSVTFSALFSQYHQRINIGNYANMGHTAKRLL